MAAEPTTKTAGVGPMEFEKPLRSIEQSINELEAEQERTGQDREPAFLNHFSARPKVIANKFLKNYPAIVQDGIA